MELQRRMTTPDTLDIANVPANSATYNTFLDKRSKLDGELFFDLLLVQFGGLEAGLYPPKNPKALAALCLAIHEAQSLDELKRCCYYYYILLHGPASEAEAYAVSSNIPFQHRELIKGYHCLDNLQMEQAVVHLTCGGLHPNFPEKIVSTLLAHGGTNGSQYVVAFVDTSFADIPSSASMQSFSKALCRNSMSSAMYVNVSKRARKTG